MDPASSVAGLISLAGLVIQSAISLHQYCHKYKTLSDQIGSLIQDLGLLQDVLQTIGRINSDTVIRSSLHPKALLDFEINIITCEKDLNMWLQALLELKQRDGRPLKQIAENLKTAANDGQFSQIRAKIASHRQQLGVQLSLINT